MPAATVNPQSTRFPRQCPHCGRKPDGTYAVAAMRGLDVFFGGYTVPLLLDVPVCAAAFARRRTAALVSLVAVLLLIAAGGCLAVWFAIERAWLPASTLGAMVALLVLGGRTGWDNGLLDWWILGACARSVSSTRVRMSFSRAEYYSAWAAMNPSKSATRQDGA